MLSRRLLPALLLLCAPLWAGEDVWTPVGPEGGTVRSLAIASNGRTAYAGTATGQVLRSADAGRTWTLTAPNLGGAVLHLEADPFQAGRVYAAAGMKVWRSDDAGRRWADLTSGLPEGPVAGTALIADPLSPGVVYLAGYSAGRVQLLRSADSGASWQFANVGLPRWGYRLSLAVHPRRRGVLFAGTASGLFRSTDSGRTWHRYGLRGDEIGGLEVDPLEPSRLYAVRLVFVNQHVPSRAEVLFSEDGGGSWTLAETPGQGSYDTEIVADPFVAGTAYYFSRFGNVLRTTDGGRHWEELLNRPDLVAALEVNPRQPGALLAGQAGQGGRSILRSADRGATWEASGTGLRALEVVYKSGERSFLPGPVNADPAAPGLLYLGLWRTPDHGRTWLGPESTPEHGLGLLAVDPVQPAAVYFAPASFSSDSLYKSTDRGRTWTRAGDNPSHDLLRLLTVVAPGVLYAADFHAFYRSTDDGAHWETLFSLVDLDVQFVTAVPGRPMTLYMGGDEFPDRVRRSTDGGTTWPGVLRLPRYHWIQDLAVDPHDPDRVLVSFARMGESYSETPSGGVYRTVDGGATWQLSPLAPGSPPAFSLLFDPRRPSHVYAGSHSQVYVSEDSGVTWTLLGSGLPYALVGDLEVDPFDPDTVYAATRGGLYSLTRTTGN